MPTDPIFPWEFMDEETQLPQTSFKSIELFISRWVLYWETYNAKQAILEGLGWTFFDFIGTSLGSTTNLIANADWDGDGSNGQVIWDEHYATGQWFPRPWDQRDYSMETCWNRYHNEPFIALDRDAWKIWLLFGAGFDREDNFRIGMLQRISARMIQLKIALTLANCFCVDV